MRLIQISDLHIPDTDEDAYGIDVKKNLIQTIEHIQNQSFDALIVTGDLAFKRPNNRSYEYVKQVLQNIWKPIYIIAGNHDSTSELIKFFPKSFPTNKGYYAITYLAFELIFIDSSHGKIDAVQLEWLQSKLENSIQAYIFIHHPVLQTDVVYMESKYVLQNRDELTQILKAYNNPVYLFSGHFHIERTIIDENITQYITPSILYQINPESTAFSIGSKAFGYREIEIKDSVVSTNVVWL